MTLNHKLVVHIVVIFTWKLVFSWPTVLFGILTHLTERYEEISGLFLFSFWILYTVMDMVLIK